MANQITINIGATANDGTGDPLRTAFNDVNLNFSNVWNTGLPGSNIQFSDNRILTTNTNANLVLAPNGIGVVQANVDILPSINRGQSLGSSAKKWNTLNAYYVNADVANIASFGNLTIGVANLHITGGTNGYVLQTDGNGGLSWTAQTGGSGNGTTGGANTQVQFNDAGNFGGSAAFTFTKTSNVLTVSGNISAGNIAITNLTTSNTVRGRTATFTGDQYSDGAIYVGSPAGTVLGSDVVMQITANAGGYSQTNFQNINPGPTASSDYILTADNGNDTTHFLDMGITSSGWDNSETNVLSGLAPNNGYLYVQDGNLSLGVRNGNTSYKWNFDTTGKLTVAGDIIPTGNNTQSLGSATYQWNDLYLSNATIYLNSVPISLTAGNVLTVNGADVVTTNGNGVTDLGNIGIVGDAIYDLNGMILENADLSHGATAAVIIPSNGNTTVPVQVNNTYGNITLGTGPSSTITNTWKFDTSGTLTTPGLQVVNSVIALNPDSVATQVEISPNIESWAYLQVPNDATANVANVRLHNDAGNIEIAAGNASHSGNVYYWYFGKDGNLTLPTNTSSINYANGTPYGGSGGGSTGDIGFDHYNIYNTTGQGVVISNFNYYTAEAETAYVNIPAGNSPGDLQIVQEQGNITLTAVNKQWSFNSDESIRFPNNANIRTVDNTVTQINSVATANGAINLRTFDASGNVTASTYFDGASGTLDFYSYNPGTDTSYNWRFDNGGSFTLPNAPGNVYFGEGATQPVIIPYYAGLTISANRADAEASYINLDQNAFALITPGSIQIDNSSATSLGNDINLLSGDDILLRGRNKPNDTENEGGDINIYAGQGADAVTSGFDTGGGGDIQIGGGQGGSDTGGGFGGSSGGFVSIYGGVGGSSATQNAGSGGSVGITAGSAPDVANTALGGFGGSINIGAGRTTRINETGGTIDLTTGEASGDGTGIAGYLAINIPASATTPGGSWYFNGTGRELSVPADSSIYGASFGNFTVGCAGNTFITSSDYGANVKNWTFGYTGILSLPGITTTTGAEAMTVAGTRTLVGGFDNPSGAYAATFTGSSPVAVYSCNPNTFSAKVTFAIQTNNITFGWEQFDVAVIKLQAGGVGVTVSNRMNGNPDNGNTQVTANIGGSNEIVISLAQPGTGTAYVNYTAVEFKLPVD